MVCWNITLLFIIAFCMEQDSSITVAFDDIPEEGLNSPLRLEKLTNEVKYELGSL